MLLQLAISTAMVILTVIIHGLGLSLLAKMVRIEFHEERVHHPRHRDLGLAHADSLFVMQRLRS